MLDEKNRNAIANILGKTIDSAVSDLYGHLIEGISPRQEPDITSRLAERIELKLDNTPVGNYVFRVIANSIPDRGAASMERILGADLFISFSVDGPGGFDKGIFVQAKYDRNINRKDLQGDCSRMREVAGAEAKSAAYVWVYRPDGVRVYSAAQIDMMRGNNLDNIVPRSATGFMRRILDCYAGSKSWGIPNSGNRRKEMDTRLMDARAERLLDIRLKGKQAQ